MSDRAGIAKPQQLPFEALDPESLALEVRRLRFGGRISKAELARISGLSWRTVARIENGGRVLGETCVRLQRALAPIVDEDLEVGVGRRLRDLRRAAGVSLADLAFTLDVSESKLSRLERGRCQPRRGWQDLLSDDYALALNLVDEADLFDALGLDASAI